ncbi:MAG: ATP-binding protein [Alphaproteobacteria bacterium]
MSGSKGGFGARLKTFRRSRLLRGSLKQLGRPFLFLKPFVPQSLMARSMLILLVPLLALQLVTLIVLYERHYLRLADNLAESVVGDISTSVFMFERAQTPFQQGEVFALARQTQKLDLSFRPSEKLERLLSMKRHPGGLLDQRLSGFLDKIGKPYEINSISNSEKVTVQIALEEPAGVLVFEIRREMLVYSTAYKIAAWVLGASLLLFGAAALFMRNQIRPIRRLAKAAERFGRGHDYSLPLEGASDVRMATRSFIGMQQRLNRYIKQRTALLSGVSHDLRTPLTRMKLELAMLSDKTLAQNLNRDVADMERMIDSYLSFAESETREDLGLLDVELVINDMLATSVGDAATVTFSVFQKVENGRLISLRKHAFERSLQNLIENCRKYANKFRVSLTYEKTSVLIVVEDDGPGIPTTEYDKVFQPFYRMESSRNSKTGGQGLGLSIVQDFVRKHGGAIELEASDMGGLKVSVKLPTSV